MSSRLLWAALLIARGVAGRTTGGKPAVPTSASRDIPLTSRALRAAGVSFLPIEREQGHRPVFPGTVGGAAAAPGGRGPVEGLIEAVEVASDEVVSAGQIIIRMRSPELVQAQREFIAADANAALARDRLSRAEQVFAARALLERDLRVVGERGQDDVPQGRRDAPRADADGA